MTDNPYAPPTAVVADLATDAEPGAESPFFAVSITKLVVMCTCTFSLYQIFWFYGHWRHIEDRERVGYSPILRGLFAVFFCYQCFARVRDYEDTGRGLSLSELTRRAPEEPQQSVEWRLHAGPLAIAWIVSNFMWWLPEPFGLLTLFRFVLLIPVQVYANRLNAIESPSHDRNGRFSGWNWVAIIVGGFLISMAVLGASLPEPT